MAKKPLNSNATRPNAADKAAGSVGASDIEKKAAQKALEYRQDLEKKIARIREAEEQKISKLTGAQREAAERTLQKKIDAMRIQAAGDEAAYKRHLEREALKEEEAEQKRIQKEILEEQASGAEGFKAAVKASGQLFVGNLKNAASNLLNNIGEAAGNAIQEAGKIYERYMGSIDARLQDSGVSFEKLNTTIKNNTAANPYLKYNSVLENLSELVQAGVAENVAQRAFLQTVSEKIATTFDVAESSLLQIIRIQQADTTAARLGLEANLTRLFNYYFSDTSYLSTSFDSVQEALVGLSSQLSSTASVEFEYIVQKWLGALGSVGVSDSTLQTLAQGINYLGTGDVEALTSNTALQNLLVMASKRAGLDYSGMLTGGMTSKEANQLLSSTVSYIQEISNTSNNVVKSQYASLFGVSISDMAAFNNLSQGLISDIYKAGMTYSDTLDELNNQLSQVKKRTHISEAINNLMDNAITSLGTTVASNAALYGIYKSADILESITGGINLPFISAFGTGLDLNMSLEGLIKGTIVGIGTVGTLVSAISNLTGGVLNMEKWVVQSSKGSGFRGYTNISSLEETSSSVTYVSSTNSTGMQESVAQSQKESGDVVSGDEEESNEMIELTRAIYELLNKLSPEGNIPIPVTIKNPTTDPIPTRPVTTYGV